MSTWALSCLFFLAGLAVGALFGIGFALHRIASALERLLVGVVVRR